MTSWPSVNPGGAVLVIGVIPLRGRSGRQHYTEPGKVTVTAELIRRRAVIRVAGAATEQVAFLGCVWRHKHRIARFADDLPRDHARAHRLTDVPCTVGQVDEPVGGPADVQVGTARGTDARHSAVCCRVGIGSRGELRAVVVGPRSALFLVASADAAAVVAVVCVFGPLQPGVLVPDGPDVRAAEEAALPVPAAALNRATPPRRYRDG